VEFDTPRRIWVCGNSGSGKTTLANWLGASLGLPVYHRDAVTWDENDDMRPEEAQVAMLREITRRERWVFEGARFTSAGADGRLARCELIVHLDRSRWLCLCRALRRARLQKNRADIPPHERQPYGWEHIRACVAGYPKKRRQREAVLEQARAGGVCVVTLRRDGGVKRFCDAIERLKEGRP
jgi:adenylate kinase family enzyme